MGNVKPEDAGEWTCEMESYVLGIARGSVRKKTMHVSIDTGEAQGESIRPKKCPIP